MAEYILKVSTEEVKTKAQQISSQKSRLEDLLSEFQSKIASLESCFKSEAGENYRMQFQNISKNVNGSLSTLAQHVTNLIDVANSYEQLESTQNKKAQGLSADNIFV